jgi:ribonuclease-3
MVRRKEPYFMLKKLLGFAPKNMGYYELALLHKSFCAKDKQGHRINNERLEYLGDAILEAVVSDVLYRMFPDKEEGYLTSLRSKIVQRETLNKLAVDMGINKMMTIPKTLHSHNLNVYGNAFEALYGAIYLDRGYKRAFGFMQDVVFKSYLDIPSLAVVEQNFKSRLIEWGHKYKVDVDFITYFEKKDRDNNIIFYSKVTIAGIDISEGVGYSKRSSHQEAAKKALQRINAEKDYFSQIVNNHR